MDEIFSGIIEKFGARYSENQKQLFCDFVLKYLQNLNKNCKIESDKKNKNIIIGDLEKAQLIISAHYDTTNEYRFPFVCGVTSNYLTAVRYFLSSYKSFATAKLTNNLSNYNDNTSGVCCALKLAEIKNSRVAVVLFDNEENNLKGSRFFYKKHKELFKDKLLLNLDCVGCGENLGLIYYTYFNEQYADMFLPYFSNSGKSFKMLPVNQFYTDAKIFRKALTVSAFTKVKNSYAFYNIHTKNDNISDIKNLNRVVNGITEFINSFLPINEE